MLKSSIPGVLRSMMLRVRRVHQAGSAMRSLHMSGAEVRSTFLNHFTDRGHTAVRSSSVVPLCDPTVPFVNAGMNQFKGIFLGRHSAPHPRVVNSQKCIRVGGKHNDLGMVGADGTHHTLFEMLGNWSFGDYYKDEACRLAWELLTGPYRLRPEQLLVTYFAGDQTLGLVEDKETRDIWRRIGVQNSRIKPLGMSDNFWEMGETGPCGPCTELHHMGRDGNPTEIWNLVFIQYNRERDGSIRELPKQHVDTGMGLERATALLQDVPSNYDTDLFLPIIRSIEKASKKTEGYTGKFGGTAALDCAYRCLADHARMVSVCLADGMFPASSLNLKQIMRRSFKLSEDIFHCKSGLLTELYNSVADILGPTYPELFTKMNDAKRIIEHEENSYAKLRSNLANKWRELAKVYPEVESFANVELSGFAEGYKQFKQAMSTVSGPMIPGEVVFKLYDTHGFSEEVIERVAQLNQYYIDRDGFQHLLKKHRSKHKTSFKEQAENDKTPLFDLAIEKLHKTGLTVTKDDQKYNYAIEKDGSITFPTLNSNLVAILDANGEWQEAVNINSKENYYLVAEDTNFYCEEGGQVEDKGKIILNDASLFNVASVFKIRDIVFHKGVFEKVNGEVKLGDSVELKVDSEKRLNSMRNHTATHLLNAAMKRVLPKSVTCQVGSSVNENGLMLNLAIYGQKLSQTVILEAQSLIRRTIALDARVETATVDAVQLSRLRDVVTVPGETYPDTGLRLVQLESEHLTSRELCCGTHVPSTRHIGDFCITSVKGAGSHSPIIRALTGDAAKEVNELSKSARALQQRALASEPRRLEAEAEDIKGRLTRLCGETWAPHGEYALCLELLQAVRRQIHEKDKMSLNAVAEIEMRNMALEADTIGRPFIVHFLMCSYLMESASLVTAISPCRHKPTMVFGCANGIIKVACTVPESCLTKEFTAEKWLSLVVPIFKAKIIQPCKTEKLETFAAMSGTKVSLINCENLVHDAMKAAIKYANVHTSRGQDKSRTDKQYENISNGDSDEEVGRGHN